MGIQNKVLLSITVTFCILLGIIYILSHSIFLQSFRKLEVSQTKKNIERIENSVATEIGDLVSFSADWAVWDESYKFILDGNPEYVAANIVESTFQDSRLDFIIFVNKSAQVIFGKKYDHVNEVMLDLPAGLLAYLTPESILFRPKLADQAFGGIIKLKQESYIITAYPISDSNKEKDPRGILLMGRNLNKDLIDRLTKTTQVATQLHHVNEWKESEKIIAKEISDKGVSKINYVNDNIVIAYVLLKDIFGMPVVLIESKGDRDIYQQGVHAISYMMAALILCAVVIAIILIFIIQRIITSRVIFLEKSVHHIEVTGNFSNRVESEPSDDELGALVLRINSMLESIQISQAQLETARADAEMASLAKSEFLTSMSHELRTPLNAILGFSQLLDLRTNNLTETEEKWVSEIIIAGEYLLKLISELLELSNIESGKFDLDIKPLMVSTTIEKAVNMVTPVASQFGVRLSIETDALIGLTLEADEIRLQQIFINLLTNAIKYNRHGGRVSLRGAIIGRYCYIKVEDNGIGISAEKIDEIFKPFQRGDVYDSGIDGVGIGLSITRRLVEAMSGRVEVKSKLDVGSIFTIILPIN